MKPPIERDRVMVTLRANIIDGWVVNQHAYESPARGHASLSRRRFEEKTWQIKVRVCCGDDRN